MNKRWLAWLPLLAGAAWLALFSEGMNAQIEASTPTRPEPRLHATPTLRAPDPDALALVPRRQLIPADQKGGGRDLFAPRSWAPPAPPAGPPTAPSAPALPFAFIGKKHDGSAWEVYLAQGDQTIVARTGTTIAGTYKVERIEPPTLTLTYLPMAQAQTLGIGESR